MTPLLRANAIAVALGLLLVPAVLLLPQPARAVTILSEDFESGVLGAGWSAADNLPASGLDYWDVNAFRAYAGTYSAWSAAVGSQSDTGQPNTAVQRYDNNMEADLSYVVPPSHVSMNLSLVYWAKGEGGGGDLFQIWVDDNSVLTMLFENRGASKWDPAVLAIPNGADRLIFRWKADAANHNFEGAYVDDILLTGTFVGSDTSPPWSSVLALPTWTNTVVGAIPYMAQDGVGESGVNYVELWYQQDLTPPFVLYTTVVNPFGWWLASPIPFDTTLTGDGFYEFYTVAVDLADNREAAPGGSDANTTFDTVGPLVAVTAPAGGTWFNTSGVAVDWTGSDALSGLDRFETSLDAAPFVPQGLVFTQTFLGLGSSSHTVDVTAYDLAGNSAFASIAFGVDLDAPAVSVTAPPPGSWSAIPDVTVDWIGSDVLSGLDRFETSLDGSPFTSQGLALSQTFLNLTVAAHTVDVVAYDAVGNSAMANVTFSIDTVAPSIAVTAPAPGSWFGVAAVTVSWNGSDLESGLDRFETSLDAGAFSSQGLSTSQLFGGLTEGSHTVDVRAFDAAANTAMDSISFSVDLSGPSVSVTSPAPGTWFSVAGVTVTWTGSDALSGLDRFETSLDAGAFVSQGLSTSQLFGGLTEGMHTVDITAYDIVGNWGAGAIAFGVDLTSPALMITSPATAAWFSVADVAVTWTGSDALSGLDRFEARIDGGGYVPFGLLTTTTFTGLAEGAHTVDIRALDLAGNTATASVTFSNDLTNPVLTIMAPTAGTWFTVGTVSVDWTGMDALSGLDRYETSLDGAPFATQGLATTQTFSGLVDGMHTVNVRAFDMVGRVLTQAVAFGVDSVPPTVSMVSPAAGAWFGTSSVVVTWSGFDALSGLDRYETRLDAGAFASNGLSASQGFAALSDGTHVVQIHAYDVAGNLATTSITFGVDTAAPSVTVGAPTANAWFLSGSVTFSWSGSDALSGLDRYETRVDGGAFTANGLSTSRALSALADGMHTAEVRAFDVAGNTATASITFGVDSVAPAISLTSPASAAWVGVGSVSAVWSGSDATSGIGRYETRLDGGAYTSRALATSFAFSGLSEGVHTLDVRAFDVAGNVAADSATVSVDLSPPSLAIASPPEGAWSNVDGVTVTWTGADTLSGLDRYEERLDGGAFASVGTVTSHLYTALAEGAHTVEIEAYDVVGHSTLQAVTFHVDVTPPTLTITSPAELGLVTTSAATVTWTGEDAAAGVDHYEVSVDGAVAVTTTDLEFALSGLSDGTHSVRIWAVDAAGNSVEQVVNFRVNTNTLSTDGPFGPWLLLSLLLIPLLAALLLLLLVRRRRKEECTTCHALVAKGKMEEHTQRSHPQVEFVASAAEPETPAPPTDWSAEATTEPPAALADGDDGGPLAESASTEASEPAQEELVEEPAAGIEVPTGVVAIAAAAIPRAPESATWIHRPSAGETQCASCRGGIRKGFDLVACSACNAEYHGSCGFRLAACAGCSKPISSA